MTKVSIKAKLKQKTIVGEKLILKEEGIEGLKKIDEFLKK
jgi:hypothetical protein